MNNKKITLLILSLIIIQFFCFIVYASDLNFGYTGEYYSKGFSEYSGWKSFVDLFIDTILNIKIIDINGKIGLVTTDPLGNEYTNTNLVSFNRTTGILSFGMDFTMPNGERKSISYNVSLDGNYDINHFLDYNKYMNKSLKDLLMDLGEDNIDILLVGEMSNISIKPDPKFKTNHRFNIKYQKNVPGNFSQPIPQEQSFNSSTDVNTSVVNNSRTNITNNSGSDNYNINLGGTPSRNSSAQQVNNGSTKFEIFGKNPENSDIKMYVLDKKTFSIKNTNYNEIKWSINNEIINEKTNSYLFNAEKAGIYRLKVEIKNGTITKSEIWGVEVLEKQGKVGYLGYIIFIILIVIASGIVYLAFKTFKNNVKEISEKK